MAMWWSMSGAVAVCSLLCPLGMPTLKSVATCSWITDGAPSRAAALTCELRPQFFLPGQHLLVCRTEVTW